MGPPGHLVSDGSDQARTIPGWLEFESCESADTLAAGAIRFSDGSELEAIAVLWAAGFKNHSGTDVLIFDDRQRVVHRGGVTDSPGLYLLGWTWQYTGDSALIGWVGGDV